MSDKHQRMNKTAAYLCLKGVAGIVVSIIHLPYVVAGFTGAFVVVSAISPKRKEIATRFFREAGHIATDIFSHVKEDIGKVGKTLGRRRERRREKRALRAIEKAKQQEQKRGKFNETAAPRKEDATAVPTPQTPKL